MLASCVPQTGNDRSYVSLATTPNRLTPLVCSNDAGIAEGAVGKSAGLGIVLNQSTRSIVVMEHRKLSEEGRTDINEADMRVAHMEPGSSQI